jgi:transposase InsO family protein
MAQVRFILFLLMNQLMMRMVAQRIARISAQRQLARANHAEFVICDHTIDITYVPLQQGFMYLVAIMDWFSRYVVTWQLSNTLDGYFCLDALQQALSKGRPEIFNTDQGAQFTADAFTGCLNKAEIQISMDGRGRALDNIFVERLWRSVKYVP